MEYEEDDVTEHSDCGNFFNECTEDSAKEFCDTFLADVPVNCGGEGSSEFVDSPVNLVLSASEDDKCHDSNKENLDEADADDNEREAMPMIPSPRKEEAEIGMLHSDHAKDLEMKSRQLEGECWRLRRLLQCCYAENQILRHNLHMGWSVASAAKQESALFLLEFVLLVSLLWFMGALCLFTLSKIPHPILQPVLAERAVKEGEPRFIFWKKADDADQRG